MGMVLMSVPVVLAAVIVVFWLLFNVRLSCYLLNNLLNNLSTFSTQQAVKAVRMGMFALANRCGLQLMD